MEFYSSGRSVFTPTQPTATATTPSKLAFMNEYTRAIVHGEISILNMLASLLAKVRYDNSKDKPTRFENWAFEDDGFFASYFASSSISEERVGFLIDILLTRSLPFADCPPLRVVASNDPQDIIARTKGWQIDFPKLEEFVDSYSDTIIATEVKMHYPWDVAFDLNTSWCCHCEILELPNTVGGKSIMQTDSLGFVTASYFLPGATDDTNVQVRITHFPRNCSTPFTMDQLLESHTTEPMTPISPSEVPGFRFPVVKVPLTTAGIRPIMGATNENSQIVAIQSEGFVQINKTTPLNWECRSIVVDRDRGMCEQRDTYAKFYENVSSRIWFNNMIEILTGGQVWTAAMVNHQQHIDRS